ncbi:tRNA lysidine(34) synthetase TilS [Flavitalea sp.]|nr:tRNA lysidine(34) synthetase TilS [Flavitalea sp.]
MPDNAMLNRFIQYVQENKLFTKDDFLVLAVSGGIDSVVLVDLCKKAGFRLVVAHVNFNLREKESERDELFVRELATGAGVPVFVKNVNTTTYASLNNLSIQVAARILRYEWFELLRQELADINKTDRGRGSSLVVTAHHMDDSVETMLMNLFRGTGITGLRGILPKQEHLVRPLLCFTKNEIVDYANSLGLNWVEDSSNQLDKYTRNYFRNQLIPMLRKIYPQVDENLYQNLHRFQHAAVLYRESVDKKIRNLVEARGNEFHIPVLKLIKMPAYETILFEILMQYGFTPQQLSQVIQLLHSETGKQVLSDQYRVIKNRNWLIIAPAEQQHSSYVLISEDDLHVPYEKGNLKLTRNKISEVRFRAEKPLIPAGSHPSIAYLDSKKITFPLLLRQWKAGDYFYPLGMKKKKKIARFLIDSKLSKTDKESVWVIESGKKILWVVGSRIDDRFKITDSTSEVIMITRLP